MKFLHVRHIKIYPPSPLQQFSYNMVTQSERNQEFFIHIKLNIDHK